MKPDIVAIEKLLHQILGMIFKEFVTMLNVLLKNSPW